MTRLPTPGGDDGSWGSILNDFLSQSHNSDGSLKDSAISNKADNDSVILKSILEAKGDIIAASAAAEAARLGVGSDGQVLTADSSQATGVKWDSLPAGSSPGIDVTASPYNADPTGVADSTAAFSAAHDAAVAAGSFVYIPPGNYLVGQITKSTSPKWIGAGKGISKLNMKTGISGQGPWFNFQGSVGASHSLTANTGKNGTSVTLSTANSANYAAGDVVLLGSNALPEASGRPGEYQGQTVEIDSVNTGTGVLTLREPVVKAYNTADSAFVQKITPIVKPTIRGITFYNPNPLTNAVIQLRILYGREVDTDTQHVQGDSMGIELSNCYRGYVKADCEDLADDLSAYRYGYGIAVASATSHLICVINAKRCRHAFTTVGATSNTIVYGEPNNIVVTGIATGCTHAPFDTHPHGHNITFVGCNAIGNRSYGFQLRCSNNQIIGGISGHNSIGVQIADNAWSNGGWSINGLYVHDTHRNYSLDSEHGTTGGAAINLNPIAYNADGGHIEGCRFENIDRSIIRMGGSGQVNNLVFAHNRVRNWGTGLQGGEKAIFRPYVMINGLRCYGNSATTSVSDGGTAVFYGGSSVWGSDNAEWNNEWHAASGSIFHSDTQTKVKSWSNHRGGVLASTKLTGTFAASLSIDASLCLLYELTLSDNVTSSSIINPTTNQQLRITLKQDATGNRTFAWPSNVRFNGNAAPTLSTAANARDTFMFEYDGTNWYEVSRSMGMIP